MPAWAGQSVLARVGRFPKMPWHLGIGADVLQPDALPDANPGSTCYLLTPGTWGELCVRRDVQLPEWRQGQPPHTSGGCNVCNK